MAITKSPNSDYLYTSSDQDNGDFGLWFYGTYGMVHIWRESGAFSFLKWTYQVFDDDASGSPYGRLQYGEKLRKKIIFQANDGTSITEVEIGLELTGIHDRPFIVRGTQNVSISEEFPLSLPTATRPWQWWLSKNIQQYQIAQSPEAMDLTVTNIQDYLIFRFLALDPDGGYFQPIVGQADIKDYGDTAGFIDKYVKISGWATTPASEIITAQDVENSFQVAHAVDGSGNPRFVTMPYDPTLYVPVLELRFIPTADMKTFVRYNITLQINDAGSSVLGDLVNNNFHRSFNIGVNYAGNKDKPHDGNERAAKMSLNEGDGDFGDAVFTTSDSSLDGCSSAIL